MTAVAELSASVGGTSDAVPALDVRGVGKRYGRRTALHEVDLRVQPGQILGLIGPNGAGKSTLMSIVAGVLPADSGTVRVTGIDARHRSRAARAAIGYAAQASHVYPTLTVAQNLEFFGALYGLHGAPLHERIARRSTALGLDALMDRKAGALSVGEQRRLHAAGALLHDAALVLLDEPTAGSDVETRTSVLGIVRSLASEGVAVVYATHYLEEIADLAADVLMLEDGEVLASGSVSDVVRRHGTGLVELRFRGAAPARLVAEGGRAEGPCLTVVTDDPSTAAARLIGALGEDLARLERLDIRPAGLESAYLALRSAHRQRTGGGA